MISRRFVLPGLVAVAACTFAGPPAGATSGSTVASIKAHLLALTAMPTGWVFGTQSSGSATNGSAASTKNLPKCMQDVSNPPKGYATATITFHTKETDPSFSESLIAGPHEGAEFVRFVRALSSCHSFTSYFTGLKIHVVITKGNFPHVAEQSVSYKMSMADATRIEKVLGC